MNIRMEVKKTVYLEMSDTEAQELMNALNYPNWTKVGFPSDAHKEMLEDCLHRIREAIGQELDNAR